MVEVTVFSHCARALAYSPYGYCCPKISSLIVLGFNGDQRALLTGWYGLGQGHRWYHPALMRFNEPDHMSPFGAGGVNAYCYCVGDPINMHDPGGQYPVSYSLRKQNNHPMSSGSVRSASPVAAQASYRYRRRANSVSSPSVPPPSPEELNKWDLIGYHGSTRESAKSLMSGLDPSHMGSKGMAFGRGFYLMPDPVVPKAYASSRVIFRSAHPELYGVYTKNLNRLKLGEDFFFTANEKNPIHRRFLEIIILENAYSQVAVRVAGVRDRVVLPRSYEAPF